MRLEGRSALVTGASGGIGQAIARRLAREGMRLVLSGRREDELRALADQLDARAIPADLTRREELEALVAGAGEVDLLVANAALPASGRLTVLRDADIDRAIEVNLRAPIALAHRLAPRMVETGSGHLAFIGSMSGRNANRGASIYAATKFGLRGFALGLRAELGPAGVGVSLVVPGFIRGAGMFADTAIELPRTIGTRTPQDVADALVRAIVENRGEVTVAPVALRLGAVLGQLAPQFAARVADHAGAERLALEFERRQAHKR